jgi:predicted nucleotidyltransferase
MPVRSLNSSVLKWPDAQTVTEKLGAWVKKVLRNRTAVLRIGYFGSYARGDWGVGSDLDLLIIVRDSDQPFDRRSADWDTMDLPVPTDVMIYTKSEWESLTRKGRFSDTIRQEVVWIYQGEEVQAIDEE